jgi:hypothetical protein
VKDGDGDRLPGNASVTSFATAGGFSVVTPKKILGGNYGFQMLFPAGIHNQLQGGSVEGGGGDFFKGALVRKGALFRSVKVNYQWEGERPRKEAR